jgi:hypothetical protein
MKETIDYEYHKSIFNQITHWKDKVQYWKTDLKLDYFQFLLNFNECIELHPFQIKPEEGEEKNYNIWFLKNYPISQKKHNWPKKILELSELKQQLIDDLSACVNKKVFLQELLKKIDNSFVNTRNGFGSSYPYNVEYDADYDTYINFLRYSSEPEYSIFFPFVSIIKYENGCTLAKFRKHVEIRLTEILENKSPENKEESLTVDQIALLHYYSGAMDGMKSMPKRSIARIFAPLFSISVKNFYDALRVIEGKKLKTFKNLHAIKVYLDKNKATLGDVENQIFMTDFKDSQQDKPKIE